MQDNNSIIEQLPKMIIGESLQKELAVLPVFDANLREVGCTERLLALSTIFNIYIPSEMSAEIYSKIYLAMLRSLQNKSGNAAVKQRYENSPYSTGTVVEETDEYFTMYLLENHGAWKDGEYIDLEPDRSWYKMIDYADTKFGGNVSFEYLSACAYNQGCVIYIKVKPSN